MGDEGEFSQSILDILYATEVLCEECSNDDVSTDGDIVAIVRNLVGFHCVRWTV